MTQNPIDEIKAIRHRLGAEMDFDIHRIFEQLREMQKTSDGTYVAPYQPKSERDGQENDPKAGKAVAF